MQKSACVFVHRVHHVYMVCVYVCACMRGCVGVKSSDLERDDLQRARFTRSCKMLSVHTGAGETEVK
jgi:hypothetical protein